MKKTAFALVAVATLGLAACNGAETNTAANTAANTAGETTNEAVADVNNAQTVEEAATANALNENANVLANEAGANSSVANEAAAASNNH